MKNEYVGKRVPRVEGLEKVTGRAAYSVDVELPGMLYGAVLRSPLAHARIVAIDLTEARKARGVKAIVTGKDFPFLFGGMLRDQPFLAIDRVRHVGEPVAAVAATTEAEAQEALEKIKVQYEELPAAFDPREALAEGAPILHEKLGEYVVVGPYKNLPGTNVCTLRTFSLGDVNAGFTQSDEIFEDEFYIHTVAHTPMETHAAVAQYLPVEQKYNIWSSTDRPFRLAKELADALGIGINQVRFISTYSGGGFGGKGSMVAEAIAVPLARYSKGRPVKVVFSREEELTASQTRHAAYLKMKTGVKKDGTLVACRAEILWDKGAYSSKGPDVGHRGALTIFGPYRIPHLEMLSRMVYTNKQPAGAYRGFGTTQVTWACEVHMDQIARGLKMDSLEFRLKNGYVEGDAYINGQVMQAVGLKETLEKAAREIGWGVPQPRPSGSRFRGRGLASMIKGTATPTESSCFIKVNPDGSLTLLTSSVEIGAGQKTVLAQIAAETIGVSLDSISIPNPDTAITPYDSGVSSSRTTYHMGNAIRLAGQEIRGKILEMAGEILKADPSRLSFSQGRILDESGGQGLTVKELFSRKFGGRGGGLVAEGRFSPAGSPLLAAGGKEAMSSIFWMFATHAAEVEVDQETGVVKVLKIAAAHDVGTAVNPMGCEQQIEGAAVMGLSNALLEEFKTDQGRILNDTLADYKVATFKDLPQIVPIIVETYHPEGPFGAKGIGEPAAACTAPAIANAIYDAVGVWMKDLPITPEKVLEALHREKNGRQPVGAGFKPALTPE
jgi:CO/xanthine dehydrogenase Mo-binding subunit